jgi:hypothetical protein
MMSKTMRRSWLVVPMSRPEQIAQAARSGAARDAEKRAALARSQAGA